MSVNKFKTAKKKKNISGEIITKPFRKQQTLNNQTIIYCMTSIVLCGRVLQSSSWSTVEGHLLLEEMHSQLVKLGAP